MLKRNFFPSTLLTLFVIIFLLSFVFSVSSQNINSYAPAALHDVRKLRSALEEVHPDLYRFATKGQIKEKFDEFERLANQAESKRELISIIAEMLATVKDGHLRYQYDEETQNLLKNTRLFPLPLALHNRQFRITDNIPIAEKSIPSGSKIVSINGLSSESIILMLSYKIAGDGNIQTRKRKILVRDFAELYWMFIEPVSQFNVSYIDSNGVIKTIVLQGKTHAERNKNKERSIIKSDMLLGQTLLNSSMNNINVQHFEKYSTTYIDINAFSGTQFPDDLKAAMQTVITKKSKNVVLDLRGNSGGADDYGTLFLSYFLAEPFRYFERIAMKTIAPSFADWSEDRLNALKKHTRKSSQWGYLINKSGHEGVGVIQLVASPYRGQLYVLIDGGTFSTAADVSAHFKHRKLTTMLGEESGGGYLGNTSGLIAELKLKNSGLTISIPTFSYWNAVPNQRIGKGVQPDVESEQPLKELSILIGISL